MITLRTCGRSNASCTSKLFQSLRRDKGRSDAQPWYRAKLIRLFQSLRRDARPSDATRAAIFALASGSSNPAAGRIAHRTLSAPCARPYLPPVPISQPRCAPIGRPPRCRAGRGCSSNPAAGMRARRNTPSPVPCSTKSKFQSRSRDERSADFTVMTKYVPQPLFQSLSWNERSSNASEGGHRTGAVRVPVPQTGSALIGWRRRVRHLRRIRAPIPQTG